jgi:hypothetical protein
MKVKVAKLGRPPKVDQVTLEKVEVIASMGLIDEEIAIILDISPRTLNYWKKTNPDFLQSLKRGKLKADFQITQSLYHKAKGGDTTAQIFWLKNRRPDLWKDRQDHTGKFDLIIRHSMVALKNSMKGLRHAA